MAGNLVLKWIDDYKGSTTLDMGCPTSYSPSFSKSVSKFPIVTRSYRETFAIDSKTGMQLSIGFVRKNPLNPNDRSSDSTMWSNAKWLQEVDSAMDRWQARSDGFTLVFNSSSDKTPIPIYSGFPAEVRNVYIQSINTQYKEGSPEAIYGTITAKVGTMRVKVRRR